MERHPLDIPDFLRNQSKEAVGGRRARWTSEMKFGEKRKDEEPATKALRRQIEKEKKEKAKMRFKLLRERYGKK